MRETALYVEQLCMRTICARAKSHDKEVQSVVGVATVPLKVARLRKAGLAAPQVYRYLSVNGRRRP